MVNGSVLAVLNNTTVCENKLKRFFIQSGKK